MKKDIIFSIGGKNYKLKEAVGPVPGPGDKYDPDNIGLPEEQWTPERVEEALRPAIEALHSMHQSRDLNYMVYSELVEAVRVLETIIKKCPKKFD